MVRTRKSWVYFEGKMLSVRVPVKYKKRTKHGNLTGKIRGRLF